MANSSAATIEWEGSNFQLRDREREGINTALVDEGGEY
jgi:hypothetical protein